MSCFRPLEAYRSPVSGEVWIGSDPTRTGRYMELPCGRCVGCKLDRAREWSHRITHEAQLYTWNWFVTLTYRDEDLPKSRSLEYPHFQKFMKRLRKRIGGDLPGPEGGHPLRFFCAGEYGGRTGRPHFHAILFNLRVRDAKCFMNGSFRSDEVEDIWGLGNVQLDSVTPASAAYVAGYSQKKVYGRYARDFYEDVVDLATGEVTRRRPEFAKMSLKPGIGQWWYDRYGGDIFPQDFSIMHGGKKWKVPKFYWRKFQDDGDPLTVEEIANERFRRAEERRADSTPERRAVREEVAKSRVEMFQKREL